MTDTDETQELRRAAFGVDRYPAPLTVAELRGRLAGLPDDATLQYSDHQTPEFSDWYTVIRHVVDVTDEGALVLGSNADYIVDEDDDERDWGDEDEDEGDEDEDEGEVEEGPTMPATVVGDDGLLDWERELLMPAGTQLNAGSRA